MKKKQNYSILIANGVNLDLLGRREEKVYGQFTLDDLEQQLVKQKKQAATMANVTDLSLHFFQSNDEAAFLQKISESYDGVVLNPGAWTHTSLALADRLAALQIPFVEVHISQLAQREEFRRKSMSAPYALGVIYGFGIDSYLLGLIALLRAISSQKS